MGRIRKKSFWLITIVGPLIMVCLLVLPMWLTTQTGDNLIIEVVDENPGMPFHEKFPESEKCHFVYFSPGQTDTKQQMFLQSGHDAFLYIPVIGYDRRETVKLYSKKYLPDPVKESISTVLSNESVFIRLAAAIPDSGLIERLRKPIKIDYINLDTEKTSTNHGAAAITGLFGAMLIYFMVFLYGVQVMRGVLEEKSNRIVEVLVTTIKPIELMLGKILGIAAVGLTQFLLWTSFSTLLTVWTYATFRLTMYNDTHIAETLKHTSDLSQAMEMNEMVSAIDSLPFGTLLPVFVFYFLGGYLLYAALFAAAGAASDTETDTQQFMFPITAPLVGTIVFAQSIVQQPDSTLAFWLSIIPFTSPIAMMVRLPFGVPAGELLLSMALLLTGFLFITWISARIYRTGILMYGKKAGLRELVRWMLVKS